MKKRPPTALREHRCPIPTCRKRLVDSELFMCAVHEKMIPPVLLAAVIKTTNVLNQKPEGLERDPAIHDYRMARALSFAAVCDQLGIDTEALVKDSLSTDAPRPAQTTLSVAVRRELKTL